MPIKILRGGIKGPNFDTVSDGSLAFGMKKVEVNFYTGGDQRRSDWCVEIEPDQFEQLAKMMVRADAELAINAFGSALANFETSEPIHLTNKTYFE